jgi:DNA-binding CsgD family transcriptional regulator/tetratricopeptide (TPR) repeat protein
MELLYEGRREEALEVLADAPQSAERSLREVRVLLRLGHLNDARRALGDFRQDCVSSSERLRLAAAAAVVAQRLHDDEGTRTHLGTVDELRRNLGTAGPSEACYDLATVAWLRNDLETCARELSYVAQAPDCDENLRARALHLESWMHASAGDFDRQRALLVQVVRGLRALPHPDLGLLAEALETLSARLRERYDETDGALVAEAYQAFPYPERFPAQLAATARNLAWTYALQGRYIEGIRLLNAAPDLAPLPLQKAFYALDHAWIAFASGEEVHGTAYLLDGCGILDAIEWERSNDPSATVLLLAAELHAPHDPKRARGYLERFRSVFPQIVPTAGIRHTSEVEPIVAFVEAWVLKHEGGASRARHEAKRAYEGFVRAGFEWRAARAALLMYACGGGDRWLSAAREWSSRYPRSFVAAELARLERLVPPSVGEVLTPRQREIVDLLRSGASIDEVAAAVGASRNTVRVHISRIHRRLGVRNRAQLLARVAELRSA